MNRASPLQYVLELSLLSFFRYSMNSLIKKIAVFPSGQTKGELFMVVLSINSHILLQLCSEYSLA